jgi:hypothetical protein
MCFCVFVYFLQYCSNTGQTRVKQLLSGQSLPRISDLLVVATVVVVIFSKAIVIIVIVVLGHVRDAV